MRRLKEILIAVMVILLLLTSFLFGQQWDGNNNLTDPIGRTGAVGIGTVSPTNALEIYGDAKRLLIRSQTTNTGARPGIIFGSNIEPFFAGDGVGVNNDQIFNFYYKWAGVSRTYNAEIRIHGKHTDPANANWNKYLALKHDGTNGRILTDIGDLVLMETSGNVGIGTGTSALNANYKLSVNGKIRAKEVVVESPWPDFVFADDYQLKPLSEVEQYLKANKHLPEIPSAPEVGKNGVSVGEMQAKLLQKIEELTLYVIALQKENECLHQRVSRLEKQ